jgi:hypothetical protein
MTVEAGVGVASASVLTAGAVVVGAAQQFNDPPIGLYIAFGSLLMAAVGVLLALLRAMSGYGREQGEIRAQLDNLMKAQAGQISASEVKLMMENLTLKIDTIGTRMNEWTGSVTYDLRRLRESHRQPLSNEAHREEARQYLDRERENDARREDLR